MEYKNVKIKIEECQLFVNGTYTVSRSDGLVYRASSVVGTTYAVTPLLALGSMKQMIDNSL